MTIKNLVEKLFGSVLLIFQTITA